MTNLYSFLLSPKISVEERELIVQCAEICKRIAHYVDIAPLSNLIGSAGTSNFHHQDVQKLDQLTDKLFRDGLAACETVAGLVSEESEEITVCNKQGRFVVAFDPLDGSSNIGNGAPIGSIFAVYDTAGDLNPLKMSRQTLVLSGYTILGANNFLVLATPLGVTEFVLHRGSGEYVVATESVKIPSGTKVYSINEGNSNRWTDEIRRLVAKFKESEFSLRYIGSMVADVHRTLKRGGLFLYPADVKNLKGKLRLLYECHPLAMIVEKAGGRAITNGRTPVLDIVPGTIHETSPFIAGDPNLIELL